MALLSRRRLFALEVTGLVAFVALLVLGLTAPAPVEGPAGTVAWSEMDGGDTLWSGMYIGEDKIGYSSHRTVPTATGAVVIDRAFLRIGSMGEDREVHTYLRAELDAERRATSFSFEMQTGPTVFRARGRGTEVRYSMGGGREEVMDVPELPMMSASHTYAMTAAQPGETVELPYFDPSTMTANTIQYHVRAREPVPGFDGVEGKRIEYELMGQAVTVWVDEQGAPLREEGLLGMVVLREPKEIALTRGWKSGDAVDLVALSAVPVDRPIDGARGARVLVVRLHGPETLGPLLEAAHGDRWDGTQLGVHVPAVADLESYPLPATDPAFAPYLAPEALIEADDPAIVEAVNGVIGDETDALTVARRLEEWVHHELEKTPVVALPSARTVLEQRRGDCNEHTALFTAMARAAGLPTRVAAGIVYTESLFSQGSFYYHAWPEVWLGQWVPLDPTFGQLPADATHIKLVQGGLDQQVELIGVIGGLSVEVVEVR